MLAAEKAHRGHAIVEQVIADLKNGPLAHLPSGSFAANSAWVVCAAMAFNVTRSAGVLASVFHATATTGTIRGQLINVPGPARSFCPPPRPAPSRRLALGDRLDADGHGHPSRTTPRSLTHPPRPPGPTRSKTWTPPGRRGAGHTRTPSNEERLRHLPRGLSDHQTVDPGEGEEARVDTCGSAGPGARCGWPGCVLPCVPPADHHRGVIVVRMVSKLSYAA